MKILPTLCATLLLSTAAWSQELIVPLTGPLDMKGGGRTVHVETEIDAVLISAANGQVEARPFFYIKKADLGAGGVVTREGAELFVEPYEMEKGKEAATVSKGTKLRVISDFGGGDTVWVYSPNLPAFTMKTPRWFHKPGKVAWTTSAPGVSAGLAQKLTTAKTATGVKFPYVFLPTWFPQAYSAVLKDLSKEDRFGPSYRLNYKNGSSSLDVDYATGGIGDRWLEKPAKLITIEHPYFGEIAVAKLGEQRNGGWTTNWISVPGVLTPSGERRRNGYLGLFFSSEFTEAEIKKVVLSLKAVQ